MVGNTGGSIVVGVILTKKRGQAPKHASFRYIPTSLSLFQTRDQKINPLFLTIALSKQIKYQYHTSFFFAIHCRGSHLQHIQQWEHNPSAQSIGTNQKIIRSCYFFFFFHFFIPVLFIVTCAVLSDQSINQSISQACHAAPPVTTP